MNAADAPTTDPAAPGLVAQQRLRDSRANSPVNRHCRAGDDSDDHRKAATSRTHSKYPVRREGFFAGLSRCPQIPRAGPFRLFERPPTEESRLTFTPQTGKHIHEHTYTITHRPKSTERQPPNAFRKSRKLSRL